MAAAKKRNRRKSAPQKFSPEVGPLFMPRLIPLFIDNTFIETRQTHEVLSPFDGRPINRAALAAERQIEVALEASVKAQKVFRFAPRRFLVELLIHWQAEIVQMKDQFISTIVSEAGKPLTLALAEFERAQVTLTASVEEAKRLAGELIALDFEKSAENFGVAEVLFEPRGVVLAITPFNFPLNLALHKVAPAFAAGCSVILKPSPQTAGVGFLLAKAYEQAVIQLRKLAIEIPPGVFQVLQTSNALVETMAQDSRIAVVSFTGSEAVGWGLQKLASEKKVCLELGGNAAVIVDATADLSRAASRCAFGAFAYAGQSCISVQRVYVEKSVFSKFEKLLVASAKSILSGDPNEAKTVCGPMVNASAADRFEREVKKAKASGAKVLVGGKRVRNVFSPTVLTRVSKNSPLVCDEAFAPVVVLEPYSSDVEAIALVNDSRFGLQAGVFSNRDDFIQRAIDSLEVGGVIVNDIPTFRSDVMPYGGIKRSGTGHEGVRYAMAEYSQRKTVLRWRLKRN